MHRNHRKNGLRQREPQRDGAERLACIKGELARRCGQRSMHHQSLAAEAQKVKPDAQHPRRLCAGNQQAGREQQQDILEFHGIVIYLLYLIDTWPSRFVALGTTDDLPSVPVRLAQRRRMLTDALSCKAAGRAKSKTLKPGM